MELKSFVAKIIALAHDSATSAVRATKTIVTRQPDADLPCRADGTPYTRVELIELVNAMRDDPAHPGWHESADKAAREGAEDGGDDEVSSKSGHAAPARRTGARRRH
jgi:hypothetical protein